MRRGLADRLLSLAAAPTFALMALLTQIQDGGASGMLCSADALSWTGMVPMYLLMSAFHSAPWLRLIKPIGADRSTFKFRGRAALSGSREKDPLQ